MACSCTNSDYIFSEDFESENYKDNWKVYWGSGVRAGIVKGILKDIRNGKHSVNQEISKSTHEARGKGEFIPPEGIEDT